MPFIIILIVIVFIIIIIVAAINTSNDKTQSEELLKKYGLAFENLIRAGKYTCGHPDINEPTDKIFIANAKNSIIIFADLSVKKLAVLGEIPISQIININIEDETTVQKRVTVARLLAVGIFAFAWKKKEKNELAYLIIEWNDGRFSHETIFEFAEHNATQHANILRNNLINICR